jgi:3-methyl-2-oxobutanoate hydroxymethyltransferase
MARGCGGVSFGLEGAMTSDKITVPAVRARKRTGPKLAVLTAYDATMAALLDEGGADVLLVGDSLGTVIAGQPNTLSVTLDQICYHGRAVRRATRRAHVVGDMPFMSYQVSADKAVEAAGAMLKEGGVEAVKLEGGEVVAEQIRRIVSIGIPVMGHVGLTPQSVHAMGGYRVQGRTPSTRAQVLRDARAVEQAGAYSVVLEGIPADLAREITDSVGIPTIGIGAGPHCDGQVLVCYDFLGMTRGPEPRFVKHFAELGAAVIAATRTYVSEVRAGSFPTLQQSYSSAESARPSAESNEPPAAADPEGPRGAHS